MLFYFLNLFLVCNEKLNFYHHGYQLCVDTKLLTTLIKILISSLIFLKKLPRLICNILFSFWKCIEFCRVEFEEILIYICVWLLCILTNLKSTLIV